MRMNDPTRAAAVGLSAVSDVPQTPEERVERVKTDRALERAMRDHDRYYRTVHLAFVRLRHDRRAPATGPQTRTRPRGAGRPSARSSPMS